MRIGLVSDVHGNLHALRAVLGALREADVDSVLCAGDLVGYGPHPNECVELLLDAGVRCVAGNHDLMAIGRLPDVDAPPRVRRTQAWTRSQLTPAVRDALAAMPRLDVVDRIVVTHGSLTDPTEYVRTDAHAHEQLSALADHGSGGQLLVLGHTHFQRVVTSDRRRSARRGTAALTGERQLVNPGSVGQSRQWELAPRARFAVLDLSRRRAALHAIDYDRNAARAALREQGLPLGELHAPRSVRRAVVRRARRALDVLGRRTR